MKNKLKFSGFILVMGLLQVTVFDVFKLFNIKPDLLLISVVIAGLSFDFFWVLVYSLIAGAFKDIFGTNTFGLNTVLFVILGYLVSKANKEISIDFFLIRILVMAVVALASGIVNASALVYFGNIIPLGVMLRSIILNTIYTTALFPIVSKITKP